MEKEELEKVMLMYFSGADYRPLAIELMKSMEYELAEMFEEEIIRGFAFDDTECYFEMMNDLTFSDCSFKGIEFNGFKNIIFEGCEFNNCIFLNCSFGGEIEDLKIFVDCHLEKCHFNSINYTCDAEYMGYYFDEFRKQLVECTFEDFTIVLASINFDGDESLKDLNGSLSNCGIENIKSSEILRRFNYYNCSFGNCNLSGINFYGENCSFHNCILDNIDFLRDDHYSFVSGDLSYAQINFEIYTNYETVILTGASLGEKVDLDILSETYEISEINLDEKVFIDFDFTDKNMENMSFVGCDLEDCDFRRSYLGGTDFSEANLEGAIFRGAELTGVNFENADLTDADFTESTDYFKDIFNDNYYENDEPYTVDEFLQESNVYDTEPLTDRNDFCFENFDNLTLTNVKFYHKNMDFVSFKNADLSFANFSNCILKDVDFTGANLSYANFNNAILINVVFEDAVLDAVLFDDFYEPVLVENYNEIDDDEFDDDDDIVELDWEDL